MAKCRKWHQMRARGTVSRETTGELVVIVPEGGGSVGARNGRRETGLRWSSGHALAVTRDQIKGRHAEARSSQRFGTVREVPTTSTPTCTSPPNTLRGLRASA